MKKNVSGQVVVAQMVSKTDGSAVTSGTTTCYVLGDGGTQATGSVGSGACTHEGNGVYSYAPAQAETNYDHVAFTFVNTNAVNVTVQIYPSFPQTGDNFARLGAPAGASVSADIAAIQSDTNDIQTRLPAALASGGLMAAYVQDADTPFVPDNTTISAIATNTNDIPQIRFVTDRLDMMIEPTDSTATDFRFDAVALELAPSGGTAPTADEIADEVQTRTIAAVAVVGAVSGNVTGSVGNIASGGITSASFAAGAINAAAIASDAITDAKVAADVTIASVTGSVGSVTGSVGSVTGSVGSVVGAVGSVTGNVGGNVTGSVGSVATGGITSASFGAGAINAAALAADAITAAKVAADVTTELQSGLATSASITTLTNYVNTEVADILAIVQKLDGMLEADTAGWRFTVDALGNFDLNYVEGTKTWRESARLWNSNGAGKTDLSGTTWTIRDIYDTKDRVVATTDSSGRRTAVTLDLS